MHTQKLPFLFAHFKCLDRDRTMLIANAYTLEKEEGSHVYRSHLVSALLFRVRDCPGTDGEDNFHRI